jgi:hypothetical protein
VGQFSTGGVGQFYSGANNLKDLIGLVIRFIESEQSYQHMLKRMPAPQ